jgi:8-oxo-dGTP pyrophosphatase MutT (NUDIX family)
MPLAQASVIPFRFHDGQLEFCLITSIRARKWGFPKGLIDPGETAIEAGLKEAWEEAGLTGKVVGEPLGRYQYEKWGETLEVEVFLMQVDSAADTWLEAEQRDRRWATGQETLELIAGDKRAKFFEEAWKRAREAE